jgi:hypothetical protein
MAQTYEVENLATSETFQVRFLIGDTNLTTGMMLEDEEIAWLLSTEANIYMAAAAAAEMVMTKMGGAVVGATGPITRKRVGQTDITYANGRTSEQYSSLASSLRARGSNHQMPFAGGISVNDKYLREIDLDRPEGRIRLGQFDSPDSIRER